MIGDYIYYFLFAVNLFLVIINIKLFLAYLKEIILNLLLMYVFAIGCLFATIFVTAFFESYMNQYFSKASIDFIFGGCVITFPFARYFFGYLSDKAGIMENNNVEVNVDRYDGVSGFVALIKLGWYFIIGTLLLLLSPVFSIFFFIYLNKINSDIKKEELLEQQKQQQKEAQDEFDMYFNRALSIYRDEFIANKTNELKNKIFSLLDEALKTNDTTGYYWAYLLKAIIYVNLGELDNAEGILSQEIDACLKKYDGLTDTNVGMVAYIRAFIAIKNNDISLATKLIDKSLTTKDYLTKKGKNLAVDAKIYLKSKEFDKIEVMY